MEAHGHPAAQVHRAPQRLVVLHNRSRRVADVGEHPATEIEQRLSCGRELHLTAEPQEQRLLELFLEKEHLAADRRLRHVQLARGSGERAGLGDGLDDFQLAYVHDRTREI